LICHYRLIRVDGNVLHYDLLMATPAMLIEPFSQHRHRAARFIR
jgi:hypothetical protein